MAALRGWQARGWRGLGWRVLGWRVLGWRVRGWRGLGWRGLGWRALMGWLLVAQSGLTCGVLAQPSVMPILRIENGMHTDQVRRVLATADGEIFATISADKTARLWGGDGMLIRTLRPPIDAGPEGMLRAAALSQERRLLVAAGSTGAAWGREALIYIFPLDRDRMQRLPTGVPAEVTALAFAPGGDRLAIGFDGQAGIAIFNFATSEIVTAPQLGIRNGVTGLAFDAGGNLAIGAGDGNIHLLDLRLQPIRPPRQLPEGGRPADLAFSPDGRLLAVGHANMPVVRLLDARTLELRGAPPLGQALGRQRQSLGAVAWTAGPGGQAVLHAAGYVLDAQGRSALLRWTNLQASPAAILPLGRDTIFHLQGLAGGRIAYAGAEPAWGVVAADGRAGLRLEGQGGDFRSIGAGLFRLRPDDTEFGRFPALGPGSFRISADAMIVEFGMDAGGQRPLRFDVRRRALEPSQASAPQAARPPLTLPLRDWMNGASPYFGTQRLRLSPGEHARSAAPLPDGGFLLGTDTHLRRYDARGGEVSQEAVMAAVWGVQASADGTQAVVALGDGTIRWHGLDAAGSMPERAAFFAHRDGRRWLLWTPEGFFDHSDQGGQDLAGYHLNRRVQDMAEWVNFAQLYRVFHAEDLVRARLAREDEAPLRQRLAEIGDVRRLLRQAPAPSVTISALCFTTAPDGAERCQDFSAGGAQTRGLSRLREAALPVAQAAAASGPAGAATLLELPSGVTRVRLRATLVDRGGGLGQTDMLLNGRNVGRNTDTRGLSRLQPGQAGGTAGGMQPGTLEYSRSIELDPGSNTLQLRVFDGGNETFGQSAILELRRAAVLAPSRPALHVLAIGVDDYAATTEAGLGSLLSAVADSRSLVEALRSRVARDYDRVNAIILSDSDATLAGIEAAFLRLGREARAEDTVLVYLAGHGLALQDRYVFVPYTRESADLAAIGRKSLDDRRLIELWSAIPARNALLMIDTCHAGAFNMDFAGTLQNETGRLVLAAASAQQVAADRVPGTRHGPFALAIQEALRGEASRHLVADGTDQLTLGFHVRDRVPELARRAQVEQRVSFRLTSGELPSPFLLTRRLP